MDKYVRPLGGIALVFMAAMATMGWYIAISHGAIAPLLAPLVLGTVAVAIGVWGFSQSSPLAIGVGALAAGILFPTPLGIVPMVVGFVIFILLSSLKLVGQ